MFPLELNGRKVSLPTYCNSTAEYCPPIRPPVKPTVVERPIGALVAVAT
jgi:hypothetical protein